MMSTLLGHLLAARSQTLNAEQSAALQELGQDQNVFLSGQAGTGKSYLLKEFLRGVDSKSFPTLASTGAAAVLIGGRTFHSFFGLGILEGGPQATLERALKDKRLARRLRKIKGFVLDEISMIPGAVFAIAEKIASLLRADPRPWGGLQVIAVGDFAQLPPVSTSFGAPKRKDWCFLHPAWQKSEFKLIQLTQMMRSGTDAAFCEVLNDVRSGKLTDRVTDLLNARSRHPACDDSEGTVLYARKVDVERINLTKLAQIKEESLFFETQYSGAERYIEALKKQSPVPPKLELKVGALVMCRQNDTKGRYVNGSLGHIKGVDEDSIGIRLLGGSYVDIEKTKFSMLDAEGNEVAVAKNFPLNLAYALTIHKSQGTTLDSATVSLRQLWEPGQAYVALSRLKSSKGLTIDGWDDESIFADPDVESFHRSIAGALSEQASNLENF